MHGPAALQVTLNFIEFIVIFAFQLANVTGFDKYLKRKCSGLQRSIRYEQLLETEVEYVMADKSITVQLLPFFFFFRA